jgi:hypothetical protein
VVRATRGAFKVEKDEQHVISGRGLQRPPRGLRWSRKAEGCSDGGCDVGDVGLYVVQQRRRFDLETANPKLLAADSDPPIA